jgi:hypothetical protein
MEIAEEEVASSQLPLMVAIWLQKCKYSAIFAITNF